MNPCKGDILAGFWGDAVEIDDGARMTWMRQPHYYMAQYVSAIVKNFNATAQNVVHRVHEPAIRCSANPQTTISHGIARTS